VGTRVAELLLEIVLMACTFGFGWVGWWIVAWADGQTPSKVVLHLHVVNVDDGRITSFGRMALREVVGKGIAGVVALAGVYYGQPGLLVLVGVYLAINTIVMLSDARHRALWDRLAKTVVLDGDPPVLLTPPVEADTALS
jgi:uncharacterized RDD family membrane protein YckC